MPDKKDPDIGADHYFLSSEILQSPELVKFHAKLAESLIPLHSPHQGGKGKATSSRYGKCEQQTNFLWEKMKEFIGPCCSRRAYLVTIDPFRAQYKTSALLGPWTDTDIVIWNNVWMSRGFRSINEGKLFKEVSKLNCGYVFGVWWQNSSYISENPKKLGFEYGLSIPIFSSGKCIGILTIDLPDSPLASDFEGHLLCAKLIDLCQIGIMPIILPGSHSMENTPLMDSVARITGPVVSDSKRYIDACRTFVQRARSNLTNEDLLKGQLCKASQVLNNFQDHIVEFYDQMQPEKTAPGFLSIEETKQNAEDALKRIMQYWGRQHEILAESELEVDSCFPASKTTLFRILRELLLNAWNAIEERHNLLKEKIAYKKLIKYKDMFGPPKVSITIGKEETAGRGSKKIVLSVVNNGEEMPEYVRSRAIDFGFSTRDSGTGIGLSIVEAHARFCNGQISFIGTRPDGTTATIVEFSIGEG